MPIGNQEIWDKGIGAGATNVVFGGGDTQPSSTNFNPGALGADPTQKPADPAAPAAPAAPATPATPEVGPTSNPNQQKIHQINLQIIRLQAQLADVNSRQPGGSTSRSLQNQITQLQFKLKELQYNGGIV